MRCCRCKHTNTVCRVHVTLTREQRCRVRRSRKSVSVWWRSCWRTCLCSRSGSQMFRPGLLCSTSSSCWTSETNQTPWLCPSPTASASATRNESEETSTSRGRNTAWRLEPTPWLWACWPPAAEVWPSGKTWVRLLTKKMMFLLPGNVVVSDLSQHVKKKNRKVHTWKAHLSWKRGFALSSALIMPSPCRATAFRNECHCNWFCQIPFSIIKAHQLLLCPPP